jgi:hypothetical protein
MMNKNYRNSLRKWDAGLWERLKEHQQKFPKESKEWIFTNLLWKSCGFCREFGCSLPRVKGVKCPLRTDKTCARSTYELSVQSPISKMKHAWKKGDKRMFERHRKKFHEIMKTHKDKFRKEIR